MANCNKKYIWALKWVVMAVCGFSPPVTATGSSVRIFTYTPNQITEQQEDTDFSSGKSMVIGGATKVVIEPYVLATSMMLTSRTLNFKSSGITPSTTARPASSNPNVEIKLYIPACIAERNLYLSQFQLNGRLITPINLSSPSIGSQSIASQEGTYRLSSNFVHLFFDRREVMHILGPTTGDRVLLLKAELGTGHFLSASDTIKVL
jgi:hypothetical protein